mmetsp:Transcript_13635/g.37193  ORF Transcript_13635/g.37193 Transcript_13635/m.37193 type:complete len:236 (-) Transcript_13635:141-848(-)
MPHSMAVPTMMLQRAEGTRSVSFGRKTLMRNATTVMIAAKAASSPVTHGSPSVNEWKASGTPESRRAWCTPGSLKLVSCAKPMTSARPLQKPIMTGVGINTTSDPTRSRPRMISMMPMRMTATKTYSGPLPLTVSPSNTAMEPVAPQIMAGRPPRIAVTKAMTQAECKPIEGVMPAESANATASGTNASATVTPQRISSPMLPLMNLAITPPRASSFVLTGKSSEESVWDSADEL